MTETNFFEFFSFAAPSSPSYDPPPFYMANGQWQGAIGIYESPDGAVWTAQSVIPDANIAPSGFPAPWPVPAICLCGGVLYVACTSASGEVTVWQQQGAQWTRIFGPAAGLTVYQPALAAFAPLGAPAEFLWLFVATPAGNVVAWVFDGSAWSQPFTLQNPSGPLGGDGSLAVAPLRPAGSNPALLLLAWGGRGGVSPVTIWRSADGHDWYDTVPNPALCGTPAVAEAVMAPGGYVVGVIGDGDGAPYITSCWGNGAQTAVSWESASGAPAFLVPPGGAEVVAYGVRNGLLTQVIWPVGAVEAESGPACWQSTPD